MTQESKHTLTAEDKQRIEQEASELYDKWRERDEWEAYYSGLKSATLYERARQAELQIESDSNVLLLVKLLDLCDRCYHYMSITPPDNTKMIYNEWNEILDHLAYYKSENTVKTKE